MQLRSDQIKEFKSLESGEFKRIATKQTVRLPTPFVRPTPHLMEPIAVYLPTECQEDTWPHVPGNQNRPNLPPKLMTAEDSALDSTYRSEISTRRGIILVVETLLSDVYGIYGSDSELLDTIRRFRGYESDIPLRRVPEIGNDNPYQFLLNYTDFLRRMTFYSRYYPSLSLQEVVKLVLSPGILIFRTCSSPLVDSGLPKEKKRGYNPQISQAHLLSSTLGIVSSNDKEQTRRSLEEQDLAGMGPRRDLIVLAQ